jgi:peroxiredoxin
MAVAGAVLLAALAAGGGWVLVLVMTQQGRLLLRMEALEGELAATGQAPGPAAADGAAAKGAGLPVGVPAPGFILADLAGQVTGLETLRAAGKPVLLVFTDPGCRPCTGLLPEIGRWQREYADQLVVTLISRGPVDAVRAKAGEHGLSHVLVQRDREVERAYQAPGTPSAVLISRDGTVGSPVVPGPDAVRALLARTINRPLPDAVPVAAATNGNGYGPPRPVVGARMGDPAPDFTLPDLADRTVRLSDLRGSPVLVLFWNPGCGFCQAMLPDLQAWQARPRDGAPQLLVVSTGSVADNQALGLRAPVLLDNEGTPTGRLFGATGTPMAVLIDAQGMITSQLAAGAPAVLALAGADNTQPTRLPLVARSG